MELELYRERYSPLGNISGEGLSRVLGTPMMDPLSVMVRETVQNSWDARLDGQRSTYRLHLRRLAPEEAACLQTRVLGELPEQSEHHDALSDACNADAPLVLEVADFGTSGLGGPARADAVGSIGEPTDFADFMRNIGSARDQVMGGGTYGYGKSSLYRASSCSTIIVHTSATVSGQPVERIMACHLAPQYSVERGPTRGHYTGRHWWGQIADDDLVDPAVGAVAADLAKGLGLPQRGSTGRGTSILVLDPLLGNLSDEEALSRFEQTLLYNFWPKMVRGVDERSEMVFELLYDGEKREIRAPEDWPPLHLYVDAYRQVKSGDPDTETVRCLRPKKTLGRVALVRGLKKPRMERSLDAASDSVHEDSHHIALMRPAELIVKYLPGPKLESDALEYAGVFIADEDVEEVFARSEPPAHDDWVPDGLPRTEATLVRVALRRLRELAEAFLSGSTGRTASDGDTIPVGLIADSLGGLIAEGSGRRIGGKRRKKKGKKSDGPAAPKKPWRLSRPEPTQLRMLDGVPVAVFSLTATCADGASPTLTGDPTIVIEGGTASASASGERPRVVAWQLEERAFEAASSVTLPAGYRGELLVAVSMPENCAVDLRVNAVNSEATPESGVA